MRKQYNVTIRMGAPYFDAKVRSGNEVIHFNLGKLNKEDYRQFHLQLLRSFREAGLPKAA
jgi:hypothetical protein